MRVLVVDDMEENRYLLQVLLKGNGYDVVATTNGAEALESAHQNPPDLIVSDILMPVMDGFTLCREWMKDSRLQVIPFIFYTATYTDERDRTFALNLGADRFIIKPEEPDVFMEIVRETIQQVKSKPTPEEKPAAESPSDVSEPEETGYLKQYNEVLVRKLENKMEQLERTNHKLLAISKINQLIVREKDPNLLIRQACTILVEQSLREAIWIALDSSEDIPPLLVQTGWDETFTPPADTLGKTTTPCREIARASEHGIAVIDPDHTCRKCPLETTCGHLNPVVALLRHDEREFGMLCACLTRDIPFADEEVALLAEASEDLGLALHGIVTEKRRHLSEQQFHNLYHSMAQGVTYQDRNGVIIQANPAAERILGLTLEQMQGRTSLDPRWKTIHEDGSDYPGDTHPSMITLRSGKPSYGMMGVYNPAENSYRWISVNAIPEFRGDEPEPYRVFTSFADITDLRRAERAIETSEKRYRRLFEAARDGILILDAETGIVVDVNPFLMELLGFSHDEILGKTIWELGILKDVIANQENFLELQQKGYIRYEDLPLETVDGRLIDVEFVSNVYLVDDKKVVQCNIRDITERIKTTESLRLSEERFQQLYDNMADGVAIYQAVDDGCDFTIVNINRSGEALSSVRLDKIVGQRITDVFPAVEKIGLLDVLRRVYSTGQPEHLPLTKYLDGRIEEWVENYVFKLPSGLIVAIYSDTTEKYRAQEALSESEERFRDLYEKSPAAHLTIRRDGQLLRCNKRAAELLGYPPDKLIGRFLTDLYIDKEQGRAKTRELFKRLVTGGAIRDEELLIQRPDGSEVWISLSVNALRNAQGRIIKSRAVAIDITKRKLAEEKLNQSHELLTNLAKLVPGVIYQYRLYPDGRSAFPYASPGMNDIYEVTPEEVREDATPVFGRLHPDDYSRVSDSIQESARTLQEFYCEFRVNLPLQGLRWRWSQAHPERMADGGTLWHGTIQDITERKQVDTRRELITQILGVLNRGNNVVLLVRDIIRLIKQQSGIDAIAIRLREGDEYPYSEVNGFSPDFVASEGHLCTYDNDGDVIRDDNGDPVLACMCGAVISGSLDPTLPYITPYGSFWTNSITELFSSSSADQQGPIRRNRCRIEGYESVALIPVRSGDTVIGLLQLNDHRKGMFSLERVQFFEEIGSSIGIAVARRRESEAHLISEERWRSYVEYAPYGVFITDENGQNLQVNPKACSITGYTESELLSRNILSMLPPEWLEKGTMDIASVITSGHIRGEYPIIAKSGEMRWISLAGIALANRQLLGFIQDITQEKQSEENLTQSRANLNRAQAIAHMGSWEWDVARSKLHWSDELYRIYGIDPQAELTYDAIVARIHPDDREKNQRFVDRILSVSDSEDIEFRIILPDGYIRDIYQEAEVRRDAEGKPSLIFGVMQDITERKAAEDAFSRERILLKTIIDNIPVVVYAKDTDYRKILANPTDLENIGKPEKDVIGHTDYDFYPKEVADQTRMDDIAVIRDGKKVIDREEFIATVTGGGRWLITSKIPLHDKDGAVSGLVGIGYDITERKHAENALVESNELLSAFIRNSPIYAFIKEVTPTTSRVVKASENYVDMTGIPGSEMVGKTMEELFPADFAAKITADDWEVVSRGEILRIDEDLNGRNYTTIKFPIRLGESYLLAGYTIDITERKQAEEEKSKLQQRLGQSQKMEAIGTLAGGIAHDFNNILSAITGYSELAIQEAPEGSQIRSDLEKILAAGNRAKGVVNQILTFSRQQERGKAPLSIVPLVKEVVKFLKASLPSTITIETDISTEVGSIMADPSHIHQIVMNLGTNAAHAMKKDGGKLTIQVRNTAINDPAVANEKGISLGQYVVLRVSDTGLGMTGDIVERIFEPYFTTKQQGEGSGLGLSIVHGIVEDLQGTIDVESSPGKGSAFTVLLPITEDIITSPVNSNKEVYTGQGRILFVDDEPAIAEIGARILTGLGYEVTAMTSSVEALEYFQEHSREIDLVISDVTMPFIPGDELAKEILALRPGMPIIICSGFSDRLSLDEWNAMGIRYYLSKPLLKSEIAEKVHLALETHKKEYGHDS